MPDITIEVDLSDEQPRFWAVAPGCRTRIRDGDIWWGQERLFHSVRGDNGRYAIVEFGRYPPSLFRAVVSTEASRPTIDSLRWQLFGADYEEATRNIAFIRPLADPAPAGHDTKEASHG